MICNIKVVHMKKQHQIYLFLILVIVSLPSCMVNKCRYSGGWQVDFSLRSTAKQEQASTVSVQTKRKQKSVRNLSKEEQKNTPDSVVITKQTKPSSVLDSMQVLAVHAILHPEFVREQVQKKSPLHKVSAPKDKVFQSFQSQNATSNPYDSIAEEGAGSDWLIILLPFVIGVIFLFIPALATIGSWIVALYIAVAYLLINDSIGLDLSWFTFFVQ